MLSELYDCGNGWITVVLVGAGIVGVVDSEGTLSVFGVAIDTPFSDCERTAVGGKAGDGNVGTSKYGESTRVEVVEKGTAPVCGLSVRIGRAFLAGDSDIGSRKPCVTRSVKTDRGVHGPVDIPTS